MHLDIKPGNILRKGTRYHLGDFGLAVHTENGHVSANKIEEGDGRYGFAGFELAYFFSFSLNVIYVTTISLGTWQESC